MPLTILPFDDDCRTFISSVLETLKSRDINYISFYLESPTERLYYSSCSEQSCLPHILEIRDSQLFPQKDFQYIMWDAFPFEKEMASPLKNTLSIVIQDTQNQTIFSIGSLAISNSTSPDFMSNLEDLKDIALWAKNIVLRKKEKVTCENEARVNSMMKCNAY